MTGILLAASLRYLLRHPVQLALALAGLALGVATIVATDVAAASAGRAFALSMEAVNGAATHQIVGGPAGLDEALYVRLRTRELPAAVAERPAMAPVVEGYVRVGGQTLQLLGIDPFAEPALRRRSGSGTSQTRRGDVERLQRWLLEPGAVTMSARTASGLGLEAGRHFVLEVGGHAVRAMLLDTIDGGPGGIDTLLLTDIAQAQEWLGLIGRLSRIDLRVPAAERAARALEWLRAQLPPGAELRETQGSDAQNREMTAAFTTNLQAMSLLALLVGVFLIYGAVSFAVVQRRRTIGILRALGVTRTAIVWMVLAEAAALGLVGVAAGLVLGQTLAHELVALVSRTINDLYFVVTVNATVLPAATVAKALVAGLGAAVLAAALPAFEAAASAPQLGLRRTSLETRARALSKWLAVAGGVLMLLAGLVVLASGRSLPAGFLALFLLLLGIAAVAPACLEALARAVARLAAPWSLTMRLACGDIAASLSRTGVAVAALAMAIAAMIGVAVMVGSFRESLRTWLEASLRADVYVSAPGPGFSRPERRLEPGVIDLLVHRPEVVAYSASRRVSVDSPGAGPVSLEAWQLTAAARTGVQLVAGDPVRLWPAFARGALIVSEPLAWRLGLSVGDGLVLLTAEGPRRFEVAAISREYGNDRGAAYVDREVYRRLWHDEALTSLGLYLHGDAAAEDVLPRLRAAVAGHQSLLMRSNAQLRTLSLSIFERTFVITRVLYWLAAGVAAIGLLSALLAWELERSRELAMLRALGMTPAGTGLLVELQTVFMGLAALLAALPAGLLTAVVLIDVINRRAFGWQIDFHLRAGQIGEALTVSLAAALAAGLYPAWRAAHALLAREMRVE